MGSEFNKVAVLENLIFTAAQNTDKMGVEMFNCVKEVEDAEGRKFKAECDGAHTDKCLGGREKWPQNVRTKVLVYFASFLVLGMVPMSAHAYLEDHPVQEAAIYPAAHPVKTGKGLLFALRHPTATLQNIGKKCQDIGEWYETKRGVKGCGNMILAGTGIGTNVLLGAKSFRP